MRSRGKDAPRVVQCVRTGSELRRWTHGTHWATASVRALTAHYELTHQITFEVYPDRQRCVHIFRSPGVPLWAARPSHRVSPRSGRALEGIGVLLGYTVWRL